MNIFRLFLIIVFGSSLNNYVVSMKRKKNISTQQDTTKTSKKNSESEDIDLQLIRECTKGMPSNDVIKEFLEKNAHPNCHNKNYYKTPLHKICDKHNKKYLKKLNIEAIKLLIEFKADIESKDKNGNTPLHSICSERDICLPSVAQLLLELRADPNSVNKQNQSPLYTLCTLNKNYMCETNTFPIVLELLLKHKADVNKLYSNGENAVYAASTSSHSTQTAREMVSILIDHKADINVCENRLGMTPFHYHCTYANIKLLLEFKFDPNVESNQGDTPLHIICKPNLYETEEICYQKINCIVNFFIENIAFESIANNLFCLCQNSVKFRNTLCTYLCCLKEMLRAHRILVPKPVNFEILKFVMVAIVLDFINTKNNKGDTALTLLQEGNCIFKNRSTVIEFLEKYINYLKNLKVR